MHQAKAYLVNSQEKHAHIRQLYTLLITQGVDILSAVQQPVSVNRMKSRINMYDYWTHLAEFSMFKYVLLL